MENNLLKNIVKVEVTGRNIDNYVKKIIKSKINIIKLKKINYKKIYLYVYYEDYLILKEFKTIYEIKLIAYLGNYKIKEFLSKNKLLLLCLLIGIFILYFLSNVIFDIEVIHSNPNVRNLVYEQLESFGIKKYILKKKYSELEEIEDKILSNNKDNIEWIEIIESGTKYIIRVEERKKNSDKEEADFQNIVASKNAVIKEIIAINGEKVKSVNDYVSKGDVIITGNMLKPDNSNIFIHAEGRVYGEVWYNVDVEYPYIYKEEKLTGNSKKVLVLKFLNNRFSLFNFNKYNNFNVESEVLFSNNLLPISLVYEKQYELTVIDDFLTDEATVDKAIEKAKFKLLENNDKILEVKDVKILNKDFLSSRVKLKLFISVLEDIGVEEKIDINKINDSNIKKDND